ncbi:DUF6178 family protein [Candidatus Binatia bacterium]|nr:DUF6178 family protein [Candidatus Binatia bacterium]
MSDDTTPVELDRGATPWLALLADASAARRRVDTLLADSAAGAVVPHLPVEDLYYLVKGVGLGDAGDLLQLAAPEQVRACLDFDLWDRDDVVTERARDWLETLTELPPTRIAAVVRTLDLELVALILSRHMHVLERDTDDDAGTGLPPQSLETPDRLFEIEFVTPDVTLVQTLWRLLELLYRADADLARQLLLETATGLQSELRETAYQWRSRRMADLGFADYYEALEVYRYLDPRRVVLPADAAPAHFGEPDEFVAVPVPFAAALGADSFLNRALARLDDVGTVEELTVRLLALLNRVLAADRVDVADVDGVRSAIARGRDTLSLGLEYVSDGKLDRAVTALTTLPLVELFRVGHSLTLDLRRRAERLRREGVDRIDLEPVLAMRPQFPGALDEEPHAGTRGFRTRTDLTRVAAWLDELAASVENSE